MFLRNALVCTALTAAVLAAIALLPAASGQPAPTQPPKGDPPLVYAELTKSSTGIGFPPSFNWLFTDGVHPMNEQALLAKINIRSGATADDASIVNGIANLGWDLISHSERAASTPPDITNGTSNGGGQTQVIEHWWFKRR